MKLRILIQSLTMFPIIFIISCDQEDAKPPAKVTKKQATAQSPEHAQLIAAMRKKQAGGLGTGSVTVNKAWTYTGYSVLDAVQGARLVAVDTTVTGHTPAFDFDDIEIIDGANRISYGSDPHITLLSAEGKAQPGVRQMPAAPDPVRVLLIYGFPEKTRSFTLYYWGKNLLQENHGIESSGWELPFPKNEGN